MKIFFAPRILCASLFSSHDIMGCSGYGFLLPQNPSVFMVTHAALIYNITAQKRGIQIFNGLNLFY